MPSWWVAPSEAGDPKLKIGLTGVKFGSLEALVPPFESSRRDLHDGHGFSDFLISAFVVVLLANCDILWGARSSQPGLGLARFFTFVFWEGRWQLKNILS